MSGAGGRTMRPRIGVTGPDRGGMAAWLATRYALWRAGAKAVRVTPRRGAAPPDLDAIVIGGGADVGWQHWESAPPPRAGERRHWLDWLLFPLFVVLRFVFGKRQRAEENRARDALELSCLEEARRRRLPVLGICRGAQLINVFLDGRLHRDLSSFYEEDPAVKSILPRKNVRLEHGSRLAEWMGVTACRVNALHRQAVDEAHLGAGLSVVARETTGVVQAIETEGPWAVLGVQWHPEYMPQRREQARLFARFVALARRLHRA